MAETILRMTGIQKYFPGVHALDNAQLEVREGEVMALVGENGAGKSTLMKVLTGIYPSDGGTIEFFGKQVQIHGPRDAQALGICIVHQELNLMQHLTVAENIYIGREPMKGLFVDKAKQNAMTQELFDKLHLDLDPKAVVKTLSVAKQQMVEITKALSHENTKLLILDEPSAVLTDTEIDDLFVFIRQLKKTGVGIVYISHRMEEVFELGDYVSVMRDGQSVGEWPIAEVTQSSLISSMVGRDITNMFPKEHVPIGETVLEVRGLTHTGLFEDVSFHVRRGEILGFSGLVGAGRTEIVRAIYGADKVRGHEMTLNGKKLRIRTPHDAKQAGMALVPEDRKREGLVLPFSVESNIAMASYEYMTKFGFLNASKEAEIADRQIKALSVKTPTAATKVVSLSGGNQQKCIVGRWLEREPKILILDEPTRGIDVGAKYEIYVLMNKIVAEGGAIIMISSELPEIMAIADRIIVIHEGRYMGECLKQDISQERLLSMAIGG